MCTCFERSGVKCRRSRPRLPGLWAAALSATPPPALSAAQQCRTMSTMTIAVGQGGSELWLQTEWSSKELVLLTHADNAQAPIAYAWRTEVSVWTGPTNAVVTQSKSTSRGPETSIRMGCCRLRLVMCDGSLRSHLRLRSPGRPAMPVPLPPPRSTASEAR
jgi:hypothetical protein